MASRVACGAPIRTALASFGLSGSVFHGPYLAANPGYTVTAVCERSARRSQSVFPSAQIAGSFEDIVSDRAIELVVVNTPDPFHGEMCRRALLAGKHVVVEKPFVRTTEEARALVSLAERQGCLLSVYYNRRFDGDFQALRALLAGGALGEVQQVESRYEFWREPDPRAWREGPIPTGGVLFNIGSHLIDQALVLFGRPQSLFLRQRCDRPGSRIFDFFRLELEYESVSVGLQGSYGMRDGYPRFRVAGSTATWTKYGRDGQQASLSREDRDEEYALLVQNPGPTQLTERLEICPGNYGLFYDQLHSCLRGDGPPPVTGEEAILNTEVLDRAVESFEIGLPVQL